MSVMNFIRAVSDTFWSEHIWLPPNIKWEQFESDPDYAKFSDLLYTIPLALLLVLARVVVERLVFRPLGVWLGVKSVNASLPFHQQKLEEAWQSYRTTKLSSKQLLVLSETTGLSERQVERWFRRRSKASRPSTLDKFAETGWRWVFYICVHLGGIWIMWDKPWVWDTKHCWYNYPFHKIDSGVWWYYMVETAFYWSLLVTQFMDVKRKDFWEMFIHHIATLSLLVLSWGNHTHRIGSIVLLLHDFVDHWVELAKLATYAKIKYVGDIAFVIFAITWVYTRLAIFPTWVIYSSVVESSNFVEMFPAYYIFSFLFTTLMILHVIWFGFIVDLAIKVFRDDQHKDNRSESESDLEEEEF